MLIIGLTGSIAMGKSTTSGLFKGFGVPVFDADRAVHDLMAPGGGAVAAVLQAFPGCGDPARGIDRKRLGAMVLGDAPALRRLEAILHPRVRDAERAFLQRTARNADAWALVDVPLLFEGGGDRRCDLTVVVSAPAWLQRQRVLARPGMTEARLAAILAQQMPDAEKRRRADFVVRTGAGRAQALADVRRVLTRVQDRAGRVWPTDWLRRGRAAARTGASVVIREIVLDTETTGLDPETGDRVVEIACVELINHLPTGNTYHQYLDPERPMAPEAEAIHGLGDAFLAGQPVFADVVEAFLQFVGDARFVIHNAPFDIKFLDHELRRAGRPSFGLARAVDTLEMARRRFPGSPASLDALCKRFGVDGSGRIKHGALIDCELLAEVYLHLIGGRQPALGLEVAMRQRAAAAAVARVARPPRPHAPSEVELSAHAAFVAKLTDPIWRRADEPHGGLDPD